MADIRNWGAFLRGRWNWTSGGYEVGFPRGCAFTDVDASVEFDGRFLLIETKHNDGLTPCEPLPTGQRMALRQEARLGKTVLVVYGCGPCNSPQALCIIGDIPTNDVWLDWRGLPLPERRRLLKAEIDKAMGVRTVDAVHKYEEEQGRLL